MQLLEAILTENKLVYLLLKRVLISLIWTSDVFFFKPNYRGVYDNELQTLQEGIFDNLTNLTGL